MLPTIKTIIFDHDGTLVDSEPVHLSLWNEALAPFECSIDLTLYHQRFNGIPSIATAGWLVNEFGLSISADKLYKTKNEALQTYIKSAVFPIMPHVHESLRFCEQRFDAIGVASGAGRNEVTHSIEAHGLKPYVKTITTKTDVVNNKPAPDVYLLAIDNLGAKAEHCVAIEDSDAGETSAIKAGMYTLRLNAKNSSFEKAPEKRLKDIDSLLAIEAIFG